MAQMASTCRAAHFGSNHAMADIPVLLHRILFDRSGETGPAGARIELRVAGEKHRAAARRSEEHTSELQSLMRISYAVFCLKKKKQTTVTEIMRPKYIRHQH